MAEITTIRGLSAHVSQAAAHVSEARVLQGLVAQWITRLPTEQKIPGSSPGEFDNCFDQLCLILIQLCLILIRLLDPCPTA